MEEIKVSIICTAYNHEKYIKSALEGFVTQKTDFPFEVIIHDDASTDGTAAIIREYAEKYPDIIVPIYQTENQYSKKVLITEDILIPMSRGKYIAFCEGDDYWTSEDKLQLQVDFLENNPDYAVCVHNSTMHDCSGRKKDELMVQNTQEHDVQFEDVVWGLRNAYQTSSLMVKREIFLTMPDFCYETYKSGFADFPNALWFTITSKVRFLPYNMSTYRLMSTASAWSSNNYTRQNLIKHTNVLISMFESVKKHVPPERVEVLEKVILDHKFNLLEFSKNYSEMTKPPYKEVWDKKPLIYKLKTKVKKYCPWLYKRLQKIQD